MQGAVLGHYVAGAGASGLLGKAVISWSSPLFRALASNDDLAALEQTLSPNAAAGESDRNYGAFTCITAGWHSR